MRLMPRYLTIGCGWLGYVLYPHLHHQISSHTDFVLTSRMYQLFQLYLTPANRSVVHRLYIAPCSNNPFIQMTIAYQLRTAAETELVKSSSTKTLVEEEIMSDAENAFEALATLLGSDEWFFGQERPGLFDASVFAYTQLVLDESMLWEDNKLGELVRRHAGLVRHRESVVGLYF